MQNKTNINLMVRVSCMTFDHSPYIVDAMNGFTMQQTTFPYVCTIVDDASTDGEPEIIRQYLEQNFDLEDGATVRRVETNDYNHLFARHKDNKNCYFAVYWLKYNHYSIKKSKMPYLKEWLKVKYNAVCEGDDFWISPQKLESQVSFLEANSHYSAVIGDLYVSDETGKKRTLVRFSKDSYNIFDIMSGFMPGLQNICYRHSCLDVPLESKCNGDMRLYYQCAFCSPIKHLPIPFAVYRKTGHGMASTRNWEEQLDAEYRERYQFHKDLGFKYNRALAKGQTYLLMGYMVKLNFSGVARCITNISKYHIPSLLGLIWYPYYSVHFCLDMFNRKIFKRK